MSKMKLIKNFSLSRRFQGILFTIVVVLLTVKIIVLNNEPFKSLEESKFQLKENTTDIALDAKPRTRSNAVNETFVNSKKNNNSQKQLEQASSSTALQEAIDTIRMEAEYQIKSYRSFKDVNEDTKYKYLITLSAMNYVQSNVNPGIYGYLKTNNPEKLPSNTETALAAGAGICGNQVQAFIDLLNSLGLKARSIQFYYKTNTRKSHIATEVYFNNKWNYIDVTFGTFFRKEKAKFYELLSFEEILKLGDYHKYAIVNTANLTFQTYQVLGINPLEYLEVTGDNNSIVVDGTGTITPDFITQNGINKYSLKHVPTHLGTFPALSGDLGNLKFSLKNVKRKQKELLININAKVCEQGLLQLFNEYGKKNIDLSKLESGLVNINIAHLASSSSQIQIETISRKTDQPCYFTFDTIEIR
jgi:hypothetical protein